MNNSAFSALRHHRKAPRGSSRLPLSSTISEVLSARNRMLSVMAVMTLASVLPALAATDLFWDPNETNGLTLGGTGIWDTDPTHLDWFNGNSNAPWINANLDNAIFGGAAGTVILGVPITAGSLTYNT